MAEVPEPKRAGEAETGCTERQRFELELEFLHCLANPGYLNWLAQNRYFDDAAFLQYLQYLQYWQLPQYAKFVVYPHSLYFLNLLQTPEFRTKIASPAYKELVHSQQFFFWQHARANRIREKAEQAAAADGGGAAVAAAGVGPGEQAGTAAMEVDGQPSSPAAVKLEPC